jgi:Ca2+-binding RTX toxin-like protein
VLLAGGGGVSGTGNDGENLIAGNELSNLLNGGGGVDILMGAGRDDILDGGTGADWMLGGEGGDIFIVDDAGDAVTEHAGEGFDMVQTSVTYSLAAGSEVEVLYADPATTTAAINLTGNEFDNFLTGNAGQNTIVGGLGIDTLRGNGGGDVFVWASTAETLQAGNAADVVMDFNRLEGDLLALNPIDADGNAANGDQAFAFVGTVDFASSFFTGAGQIGYFTTATDTYIFLNTVVNPGADGIDYEEATIRLAGVHSPDASWFAL